MPDSENGTEHTNRDSKTVPTTGAEVKLLKQMLRGARTAGKASHKGLRAQLRALGMTSFSSHEQGIYEFRLSVQSLTKTATGSVSYYAAAINPSACTNWTALAALFDQYRVRQTSIGFCPLPITLASLSNQISGGEMAVCCDLDSTSAPVSIDEILQYDDAWYGSVLNPPGAPLYRNVPRYVYTPPSSGSALVDTLGAWCDIATVANTGCFKVGCENTYATASTSLHTYVLSHVVQFRMVR